MALIRENMQGMQQPEQGGIVQPQMQQGGQQGMVQDQDQGKDQGDGQEPNVTPEEQAIYESVIYNAMTILYSDKTMPHVLTILKNASSPPEGIAQVINFVGTKIYDSAKQQGVEIPDDTLMYAAQEISGLVIEIGEEAGIFKNLSKDDIFNSNTRLLELWEKSHPGMLDMNAAQQSMQGVDKQTLQDLIGTMTEGEDNGGNTQ